MSKSLEPSLLLSTLRIGVESQAFLGLANDKKSMQVTLSIDATFGGLLHSLELASVEVTFLPSLIDVEELEDLEGEDSTEVVLARSVAGSCDCPCGPAIVIVYKPMVRFDMQHLPIDRLLVHGALEYILSIGGHCAVFLSAYDDLEELMLYDFDDPQELIEETNAYWSSSHFTPWEAAAPILRMGPVFKYDNFGSDYTQVWKASFDFLVDTAASESPSH